MKKGQKRDMKSAWFFKTRAILQNVSHLNKSPQRKKCNDETQDRGTIQRLETKHSCQGDYLLPRDEVPA